MSETKFYVQMYCTVGWDEDEEMGEVEIHTFNDVLAIDRCLKNSEGYKEFYKEIKERVKVPSGGDVFYLGEAVGIVARMKSEDGITVEMELSDLSGVSSHHRFNGEQYEIDEVKRMREAKKLATQIMRL